MSIRLFTLLLGLLPFCITNYAQPFVIEYLDFENPYTIHFSDSVSNIWQIGKPAKNYFVQSYSGSNAIMTDTLNPYPVNNRSAFSITIYKKDYDLTCALDIQFYHSFDMDTLSDSAYVDFSYDGGLNWYRTHDWDLNFEHPAWQQRYYIDQNHGGDGNKPITGNSGGWVYEEFFWTWYMLYKSKLEGEPFYPDSIIIRFNFVSDSIQTGKDGWMIDDINVESPLCTAVNDVRSGTLIIFPNPTNSGLHIRDKYHILRSIKIVNLAGCTIMENSNINKQDFLLNLDFLNPGIYILYSTDEKHQTTRMKFIKY